MAFILVQHLDPTHRSLLVSLLAEHTTLTVVQAAEGMAVEPEHLYVIPPGQFLTVDAGALHLSPPETRDGVPHGARLPFDAFLHSMAAEYGRRAPAWSCREPEATAAPGCGPSRRRAAR